MSTAIKIINIFFKQLNTTDKKIKHVEDCFSSTFLQPRHQARGRKGKHLGNHQQGVTMALVLHVTVTGPTPGPLTFGACPPPLLMHFPI